MKIWLYTDKNAKGELTLGMNLDAPKWLGGKGEPEVQVRVNDKIVSTLPKPKPAPEEEDELLATTATTDHTALISTPLVVDTGNQALAPVPEPVWTSVPSLNDPVTHGEFS